MKESICTCRRVFISMKKYSPLSVSDNELHCARIHVAHCLGRSHSRLPNAAPEGLAYIGGRGLLYHLQH